MTNEESSVSMAECGACRAVIPIDSTSCSKCGIQFTGVSDEALGACGACDGLAPLDSTSCPHCGVSFIADDVVSVLSNWLAATGLSVKNLFTRFDENNDGEISSSELKEGLLALNLADLPPTQIDRLIKILDADGNGTIDLNELETVIAENNSSNSGDDVAEENDSDDDEDDSEEEDEADEDSDEEDSDEDDDDSEEEDEADEDSDEEDSDEDDDDSEEEDGGDEDSDEGDSDDEDDDSDEEDSGDDENSEEIIELTHLEIIGQAIVDSKLSIKEVFESMDSNDDGKINGPELQKGIVDLCDENLTPSQVFDLLKEFDADDDGSLDPMELISAIESLEMGIVSDKSKPSKPTKDKTTKVFPTDLQKAMMGKKWNDVWWPLIHTAIFVLAVVWIANGLIGFVDGSGGPVAYDGDGEYFAGEWLEKGDIYPCDKEIQKSECSNSLTPLAGTNGASSMPKGFYWDGIVLILLSLSFFGGSLYSHLVLMNNWRAKAKKIKADSDGSENESKENIEDSEDHNEEDDSGDDDDEEDSDDDDDEDDSDDDDEEDSDDDDVEEDSDGDDEEDSDGDDEEDSDDDEIDIGSRIGVEIDGKEFFGEIIEFNDEEGIVVIEDEDSGEELTAMQDDMFVE